MIKFSVYELEGIVGVFGCANGKGGDTADNKIVLSIYANIVHILMYASAGFFVCIGWKLAGQPFGLGATVPGAIACAIALVAVSLATYKRSPAPFLNPYEKKAA